MSGKKYTHEELNVMPNSQLLRVAVEHARQYQDLVRSMPEKYEWDMNTWLEFSVDGVCSACMAGAVMFLGYRNDLQPISSTDVCDYYIPEWLWAERINFLRRGFITDPTVDSDEVIDTAKRHDAFVRLMDQALLCTDAIEGYLTWDGYERFADILEKEGL